MHHVLELTDFWLREEWRENLRNKIVDPRLSLFRLLKNFLKYRSFVQHGLFKLNEQETILCHDKLLNGSFCLTVDSFFLSGGGKSSISQQNKICMRSCSANTVRINHKCWIYICKCDPFFFFYFRVYFTLSCQRSSFMDHC